MKLSLVVAQGVHAGKVIPVTSAEFVIGRDPQCQLRPASPAISKQHCVLAVREGKAYIRDCGSTNGTFVNGEQVAAEREVNTGDRLKVGPLEFDIRIEAGVPAPAAARPAGAKPDSKSGVAKPAVTAAAAADSVPTGATVLIEPPAG